MRDIVKEFNLDLSDFEPEKSVMTNKEALENIKTVENVDLSLHEKIKQKIENDFSGFVHKWQEPMSWIDLALTINPTGLGVSYKYNKIKSKLEKDFAEPLTKLSDKYGAPSDKVIAPTDGMIAQMEAEGEADYKEVFKQQGFSKSNPFVSAFAEMKGYSDMNKMLQRYNAGEKLTPTEIKMLNGFLLQQAEASYRGTTMGGKFVSGLLEMPAYAGEFLATDGLGTIGRAGAKKLLTKGLQEATKKQIGKRLVRGTVEAGGDALVRTTLGMPHRVVAQYGERRLHDGLTVTDKGDQLLNESFEKPVTSFFKAYADVFIENLSEVSGAGIKIGLGEAGRQLKKALPKGALRSLLKFAKTVRPNENVSKILTKSGFNGILEEYGEERLGNLLKVAVGLDDRDLSTFEKITNALFPSPEQALIEFGLFSILGGASHVSVNLANHLIERGIKTEEVKKVLQNTSQIEKEKIVDDLIYKPQYEKSNIEIDKLHDDFVNEIVKSGALTKEEAYANADFYKNRLEAVYVKYGKELENKGFDFNKWYTDRIKIIKDEAVNNEQSAYDISNNQQLKENSTFYQSSERELKSKKGSITFTQDNKAIIRLFSNSDSSTLPHELAHFFLEDLNLISGFSKSAKRDIDIINNWLEHKNGNYTEEEHEKFARSFEQYLLTSKAPNANLKNAFESFKDWMKSVYKTALDNDITMSENIKQSFDNLFLSDEEYLKTVKQTYNENAKLQEDIKNQTFFEAAQDKLNDFAHTWKLFYDRNFLPLDTRLTKVSENFTVKVKRYTFNLLCLEKKDSDSITPFLEKAVKLKPEDFHTLDLALKNRDTRTVNILLEKLDLKEEFQNVRNTLDELFEGTQEVGMDVNYMNSYYPRMIKSGLTDNFLEYIDLLSDDMAPDVKVQLKKKSGFSYSKLLKEFQARNKNKNWSLDDVAKFFDNQIRGFGKDNILLARIGQLKFERTIPILDKNLNAFYMPFTEALPFYVANARKTIEARKFLGAESVDIQKLRKTLKQKRKTLNEVKERNSWSAKYKELTRLKYELGALNVKYENSLANLERMKQSITNKPISPEIEQIKDNTLPKIEALENDVNFLKKKIDNLEKDIKLKEELKPQEVKELVQERLRKEISNAGKKIQELLPLEQTEENIGKLVTDLIENGIIQADEEKIVKDILKAKFNYGNISGVTEWIRDIGYLGTLNDITNTLTQFTDLSFAFYQNGFFDGLAGIKERKEIDVKELGLDNAYEEFRTSSGLTKLVNQMFKVIGFEKVDALGKNVLMNSSIKHARRLLKKGDVEMTERFKLLFGYDYKQVKDDLINGKITPDVRFFAFCELTKFQPVTIDQLPEMYAKGGVYRLAYTLKTYTLKMLDVVRHDIFYQMKKNPKKALINLARFQLFLLLFGVPKDLIKDLISNKEFNVPDSVLENLIIFQLMNRYTLHSVSRDGLGTAIRSFVEPPIVRMLDNFTVPNKNPYGTKSKKPLEITQVYAWNYIPIAGSFFYDWFGGGASKRRKQKQNK